MLKYLHSMLLLIDRFSFANDIIAGLSYLHNRGMVHGRLKIENCLVDDRWTIKLTGMVTSLSGPLFSFQVVCDSVFHPLLIQKSLPVKYHFLWVGI